MVAAGLAAAAGSSLGARCTRRPGPRRRPPWTREAAMTPLATVTWEDPPPMSARPATASS